MLRTLPARLLLRLPPRRKLAFLLSDGFFFSVELRDGSEMGFVFAVEAGESVRGPSLTEPLSIMEPRLLIESTSWNRD